MKKIAIVILCVFSSVVKGQNVTILKYTANESKLVSESVKKDDFKRKNYNNKQNDNHSLVANTTEQKTSAWGYVNVENDTIKFDSYQDVKYSFGNIQCFSVYETRVSGGGKMPGRNRYYFTTELTGKPVLLEKASLVEKLFNNKTEAYEAFKNQNKLDKPVDVARKFVELHPCP